jgi:hypothetical protein
LINKSAGRPPRNAPPGHAPPDSVGESLRGLSRARWEVAASLQNAPVSLSESVGPLGAKGRGGALRPPPRNARRSARQPLDGSGGFARSSRMCCLPQSPKRKVQRRAARTGEKPVVIGFALVWYPSCGTNVFKPRDACEPPGGMMVRKPAVAARLHVEYCIHRTSAGWRVDITSGWLVQRSSSQAASKASPIAANSLPDSLLELQAVASLTQFAYGRRRWRDLQYLARAA